MNSINYIYFEVFLGFLIVFFSLTCSFKDPGIVTQKSIIFDDIESIDIPKGIVQNADFYKYRFCKTCNLERPPKSSHCQDCGNCVKEFDHHCYMIGNCIGNRNRKAFVLFVLVGFCKGIYNLLISVFCLFLLTKNNMDYFVK